MVLGTSRRKGMSNLSRLQHCKCKGNLQSCNVPFREVNMKFRRGAGCPFQRAALAPRRAQNLLVGLHF